MADRLGGRHLVLLGLMASGKTSTGRELAALLRRPFRDSDAMVEAGTGRTVGQLLARRGEGAMRAAESQVLAEALRSSPPAVIAAAAGVVLFEGDRARLRDGPVVVWLRVDPAVLAARLRAGGHRPFLDQDPLALLTRQAQERELLYAAVADLVIEVSAAPAPTAREIVARLEEAEGPGEGEEAEEPQEPGR